MSVLQKQIFDMLMKSRFWTSDQMLAFQRSQLKQLLHHAKATVPFYKTRLDVVFKKDGEIDWDRWQEIPIVTRADLRDNRDEMLTTALPPGHGPTKTFHSSGSSGVPVSVEVTQLATLAKLAAIDRQYYIQGIDPRKTSARPIHVNEKGEFFKEEFYYRNAQQDKAGTFNEAKEIVINRNLPARRKLELLKTLGVSHLFDNPNNAELLARANLEFGEGVRLEAIFCTGQELTVEQKDLFKESFGARGHIIYSSKEGGLMGFECGNGPNFHVNSELTLIETATPEGSPCELGQIGRVIITPFYSTALPLIRYDQGDTAKLLPPCGCKINLPLLGQIDGRQDQFMYFPDGPVAITCLSPQLVRESLNALAVQFAQVAPLKLEVRYIPANNEKLLDKASVADYLHRIVHPKIDIAFKPMDQIPLNAGGKQQRFVCEFAR
jgi:phenylacetate-CoA ligase